MPHELVVFGEWTIGVIAAWWLGSIPASYLSYRFLDSNAERGPVAVFWPFMLVWYIISLPHKKTIEIAREQRTLATNRDRRN